MGGGGGGVRGGGGEEIASICHLLNLHVEW